MPPTFEFSSDIAHDWAQLSPANRERFRKARRQLVDDLRAGHGFRPSLRVKGVQGAPGVFELTWAPDGRATFSYGPEQFAGETHIIWRRIGTHCIFNRP